MESMGSMGVYWQQYSIEMLLESSSNNPPCKSVHILNSSFDKLGKVILFYFLLAFWSHTLINWGRFFFFFLAFCILVPHFEECFIRSYHEPGVEFLRT